MKNPISRLGAATFILLVFTSVLSAQSEPRYMELPNFGKISNQLYRGAQTRPGGIHKLASMGIKTIINLRTADDRARAEEAEAKAFGLRYYNMPMAGYAKPTDEQVERVLSVINAQENQPIFIHCKRGADRTGTIIAAYRISHDRWTSKQAKQEADEYSMRKFQFEMRDYITDYYRRRIGLSERGDRGTDVTSTAAAATRRTLEKSYSLTRRGLGRLKRAAP
jgi:protein tyrosine/serine phosphatase